MIICLSTHTNMLASFIWIYTASFDIWSDYFNLRNYNQKLWYALIIFILNNVSTLEEEQGGSRKRNHYRSQSISLQIEIWISMTKKMVIKTYPLIYLIVPIIQTWTKLFFCIQYLCQRFLASKHMSCNSLTANQPRGVGQSVEISCLQDKICRSTYKASWSESFCPKV